MTIGHVPIRERLILPRRQGVALTHLFYGTDSFPTDTTASLYLYDAEGVELAFWPLTVTWTEATLDVSSEEWWPHRAARSFTVFVVYPAEPTRQWPWYEGSVVRLP